MVGLEKVMTGKGDDERFPRTSPSDKFISPESSPSSAAAVSASLRATWRISGGGGGAWGLWLISLANTLLLVTLVAVAAADRRQQRGRLEELEAGASAAAAAAAWDVEEKMAATLEETARKLRAQESISAELRARLEGAELQLEILLREDSLRTRMEGSEEGQRKLQGESIPSRSSSDSPPMRAITTPSNRPEAEEEGESGRGKRDVNSAPEGGGGEDGGEGSASSRALLLTNLRNSFVATSVGRVSHWLEDTVGLSSPGLRLRRHQDFELLQQGSVVRILREGLYLVYAQLWFDSPAGGQSRFEVRSRRAPRANPRVVAACAAAAPAVGTGRFDQTCMTWAPATLSAGELLHVHVGEVGRRVDAEDGRSFFGVVRIA